MWGKCPEFWIGCPLFPLGCLARKVSAIESALTFNKALAESVVFCSDVLSWWERTQSSLTCRGSVWIKWWTKEIMSAFGGGLPSDLFMLRFVGLLQNYCCVILANSMKGQSCLIVHHQETKTIFPPTNQSPALFTYLKILSSKKGPKAKKSCKTSKIIHHHTKKILRSSTLESLPPPVEENNEHLSTREQLCY